MWDRPIECAKFIDKFTKYNLKDSTDFNLDEVTRKDLIGILQLLHGFISQFIAENQDYGEALRCNFYEVIQAIALAESLYIDTSGALSTDEQSRKLVKDNPYLTQYSYQLSQHQNSTSE